MSYPQGENTVEKIEQRLNQLEKERKLILKRRRQSAHSIPI